MRRNGRVFEEPKPVPRHWKGAYDWAFAHYPELAKRYPNQWVAFASDRVLAHGKSLMTVLSQARRKSRWQEIPHLFVEAGIHVYARPA